MRRIEIIHLRSSSESAEALSYTIGESLKAKETDATIIRLYQRQGLETDVAIHIEHLDGPDTTGPSSLGVRLASALKAYGLVEHTTWENL